MPDIWKGQKPPREHQLYWQNAECWMQRCLHDSHFLHSCRLVIQAFNLMTRMHRLHSSVTIERIQVKFMALCFLTQAPCTLQAFNHSLGMWALYSVLSTPKVMLHCTLHTPHSGLAMGADHRLQGSGHHTLWNISFSFHFVYFTTNNKLAHIVVNIFFYHASIFFSQLKVAEGFNQKTIWSYHGLSPLGFGFS